MRYEKSCGAIVFTKDQGEIRYVILQSLAGFHGFPKGHVEHAETEEETALREILEETGLQPKLLEGFRTTDAYPLPGKPDTIKQIVYFLAEYHGQAIKVQRSELKKIELLTYDEAMGVFEFESSKSILKQANDFLCR